MSKFKVGDKVRVIKDNNNCGVPIGTIGTLDSVSDYYHLVYDTGTCSFDAEELELVNPPTKFKHIVHCKTEKEYKQVLQWLEDETDLEKRGGFGYENWDALQIDDKIYNTRIGYYEENREVYKDYKFCTAQEFLVEFRDSVTLTDKTIRDAIKSLEEATPNYMSIPRDYFKEFECDFEGAPLKNGDIYKINKPKKTTMSKIVKRIKDLGLTGDEKLLRKHGMHDEDGNLTEEGLDSLKLLEAQERKFKSWDMFCAKTNVGGALSALESADLATKHAVKLLEIVKAEEEETKKCKK